MTATEIFAAQCQTVSCTAASISKSTVTVQSDSFDSIMKQKCDTNQPVSNQTREKLNSKVSDKISDTSGASDATENVTTEVNKGNEDVTTGKLSDDKAADTQTNEVIAEAENGEEVKETVQTVAQSEAELPVYTDAKDAIMNIASNLFKAQKIILSGNISQNKELTKEQYEEIAELLASAVMQFSQLFNVSVEDVQVKFEQLEITTSNMFETQSLRSLVMNFNNISDPMEIINNPELFEQFTKLEEIMNNLENELTDINVNFEEIDIQEIFESMTASLKTDIPEEAVETIEEMSDLNVISQPAEKTEDKESASKNDQKAATVTDETTEGVTEEGYYRTETKKDNDAQSQTNGEEAQTELKDKREPVTTKNGVKYSTENFVAGLEHAVQKLELNDNIGNTQFSVRDVVYQVVDAIKVNISPEKSSLELNLTPDTLGKVSINISSKGGVMTAQITTDNQTAKEAIESQMQILKETIEAKGITVEAIEVTVSNFSFMDSKNAEGDREQLQNGGSKRNRSSVSGSVSDTEVTGADDEVREKQIMSQSGSTVSYVA